MLLMQSEQMIKNIKSLFMLNAKFNNKIFLADLL